jgi:O-antigen/teichoic acid export membrane protein
VETVRPIRALAREVAAGPWSIPALRGYASSSLFRNAAYLWTGNIVILATGFVFWAAAAWLYPAEAVGYGASALAAIALIGGFAKLGLGLGLIRFLPERGDSGAGLVNSVLLVAASASLGISLIFLLGLDLWSPDLRLVRQDPIFAAIFLVGAISFSLITILDEVFVATRTARFVLIKNLGFGFTRLVFLVALASFFASFGLVAAFGLAAGAWAGLSIFYLLPLVLRGYRPAIQWKTKELLSILPFSIGNHVGMLLLSAPGAVFTLIVLNTAGPESAAYFYIAWAISGVVSTFSLSVCLSLFAEGAHAPGEFRRIVPKALLGGSLILLVPALALLLMAEPVLHVFGSDYARGGSSLLRLLAIGALPYLVVNIYIAVARVQKRVWSIVLVAGSLTVTSLLAGYLLSRSFGLEGVGMGWLAGQGAGLVVIAIILACTGWRPRFRLGSTSPRGNSIDAARQA